MPINELYDPEIRLGHSINDDTQKSEWKALINGVAEWIKENNASDEFVFHGTSELIVSRIMRDGLKPTDIIHAKGEGSLDDLGSFWGDIHTAAAYAEDTVAEREIGGSPAILIASTRELENWYEISPDLATLDFPLPGLTKLDDEIIQDKWMSNHEKMSWIDSLKELGAIVVTHGEYMPTCSFMPLESLDTINKLQQSLSIQMKR